MCASEVLIVECACFQAGVISVDGKYSVSVIIKSSSLTRSYVQEDVSGNSRALLAAPSAGCKTGVSRKVLWFFNCPESKLRILNSCPSLWNLWLCNLLQRWAWKQLRPMWARPERGFAVPGGKSHVGGQCWQHGLWGRRAAWGDGKMEQGRAVLRVTARGCQQQGTRLFF